MNFASRVKITIRLLVISLSAFFGFYLLAPGVFVSNAVDSFTEIGSALAGLSMFGALLFRALMKLLESDAITAKSRSKLMLSAKKIRLRTIHYILFSAMSAFLLFLLESYKSSLDPSALALAASFAVVLVLLMLITIEYLAYQFYLISNAHDLLVDREKKRLKKKADLESFKRNDAVNW